MKIAYIFSYFGDGGAENHAISLARKAKASGNDVSFIISSFSESARKKLVDENFGIIDLPMESSFNPLSVLKSAISLKKIIKSKSIDVIHCHMLREQSLAVIAKILGAKFVLIRTFHRFDQFNGKMKLILPFYNKYTDAVISISKSMSDYLISNGLDSKKVHLIENGVDKVLVPQHTKAIGFIGRLTDEKGILQFIKANVDILHDNKLVIAGDGPDFNEIKKLADDNKLDIELLGNISNKADFYGKVSVLVLPSSTEALPLVVLEAYSCGLPVVAFNLDSLKDLIGSDNGVLVEYPNYAQMGQEAISLLSKFDQYSKPNVAKYESNYSVDKMWSGTDKLYQSLISK